MGNCEETSSPKLETYRVRNVVVKDEAVGFEKGMWSNIDGQQTTESDVSICVDGIILDDV